MSGGRLRPGWLEEPNPLLVQMGNQTVTMRESSGYRQITHSVWPNAPKFGIIQQLTLLKSVVTRSITHGSTDAFLAGELFVRDSRQCDPEVRCAVLRGRGDALICAKESRTRQRRVPRSGEAGWKTFFSGDVSEEAALEKRRLRVVIPSARLLRAQDLWLSSG